MCGCVFGLLEQIYYFINESMAVQFYFLFLLYGISHGFDIRHDLLVMAWNFNDN